MNGAAELSRSLSGAVKTQGGCVVRVEGRRRGAPSSGVVVDKDLVVTADHTVDFHEEVEVGLPDGATTTARLVGRDPSRDLALLKVARTDLTPVTWDDGRSEVGTLVLALSRPGKTIRASLGVLSAVGEDWRTPAGGKLDRYLQTDISLHAGFSGGLLVDYSGRALGLDTAGLLRSTALAIPGENVRRVCEALRDHGRIRQGYLGIGSYPVPLSEELRKSLSQKTALLIVSVEAGSPAASAGLLMGDALLQADGHSVTQAADLLPLLEEQRIGGKVALRILRAGATKDIEIAIGERGGAVS